MHNFEKGSSSSWVLVVLAAILLGIGGVSAMKNVKENRNSLSLEEMKKYEHFQGNAKSAVVFEEYADFQCPACAATYLTVKDIVDEFSTEIKFVYHPFPLRRIHKNADIAAEAGEAAGLQGKYFEMSEILYLRQNAWSDSSTSTAKIFENYARELGLDVEKFRKDMKSILTKSIVNTYYNRAIDANISHTPTFVLNGNIVDPLDSEDLKKMIIDAIGKSRDKI